MKKECKFQKGENNLDFIRIFELFTYPAREFGTIR